MESSGQGRARGGPRRVQHTPVLTDTLLPPRDPGGHPREHFTSQPLGSQGEESTGSRSCPVKASGVQAASAKVQTSSRHSRLNRESKMTASSVITPARPPLFHRRWWPGTPNTGGSGMGATSSFSGAKPRRPSGT